MVLEEAIYSLAPAEVLVFLDEFQGACDLYKTHRFLYNALQEVGRRHPGWLASVNNALTPELMFDPERGVAIVQVSRLLAETEADEWATFLLEEGGRGVFGGSGEQIDRAGIIAILIKPDKQDRLDYVRSILDAPSCPGGVGVGQSLVALLCSSSATCWPGGKSQPALDTVWMVLADPRFAREAAHQFRAGCPTKAPQGYDAGEWAKLKEEAARILGN